MRRNSSPASASAISASQGPRGFRGEIVADQPGHERRQIGDTVAHLRRAVGRVAEDLLHLPRKHVGKNRGNLDDPGIAVTRLFAGELVAIHQDDIAPAFLQVQRSANAHHARAKHENISL